MYMGQSSLCSRVLICLQSMSLFLFSDSMMHEAKNKSDTFWVYKPVFQSVDSLEYADSESEGVSVCSCVIFCSHDDFKLKQ